MPSRVELPDKHAHIYARERVQPMSSPFYRSSIGPLGKEGKGRQEGTKREAIQPLKSFGVLLSFLPFKRTILAMRDAVIFAATS